MYKTRAAHPYTTTGRTRFNLRGRPGVYIIMKGGRPLYVGFSGSDLYKAMYRHFQRWNDPRQVRVTYSPNDDNLRARVVYTNTPQQAAKLERALIIKLKPRDNPQKLLDYETTRAEEHIYTDFVDMPAKPIILNSDETPF